MKITGVLLVIVGSLFGLFSLACALSADTITGQIFATFFVGATILFSCGCILFFIKNICDCVKNKQIYMRKIVILLFVLFLFSNLSFAKTNSNNSVKHYKSGSYEVTTGNRTDTYDKDGKMINNKI